MFDRKLLILLPVLLLVVASLAASGDVNWISKDELRAVLDDSDTAVIDVRTEKDWNASDVMVKGAVREDSADISAWAKNYPKDKKLVFY
jgi:rhodanese-related sulfurtransferase